MNLLKPYLIIIRSLLFILFDSIALWAAKVPKHNQLKLILLIRQDRIGDFILWLDTAKEYRKYYPPENYKIILIGNAIWSDLAKGLPFWDEVLPVNVKAFKALSRYRWNILRKVRNFGAKIAIQPTYSREFYHGDSLIRASNASKKVSSAGNMSNRNQLKSNLADRWHTELIPSSPEQLSELERNAEFFSGFIKKLYLPSYPELELSCDCNIQELKRKSFYILSLGANKKYREWPYKYYAKIAQKIHKKTGWLGLICGAENEFYLGEHIKKLCDAPLQNYTGQTTLSELTCLLAKSQILISNETGTAHIANAVGTPTVCILGGGHFGRFVPYPELSGKINNLKVVYYKMPCYGCDWKCVYHIKDEDPAPCISNISVDAVWNEVKILL
jgi:ADP-heptose:LPS heptosyltransferase